MKKSLMKVLKLSDKSTTRLFVYLIAVAVFVCFLPTLNNGFVWDDNHNFVENFNYRGLSPSNLYWMFTTYHDANYHPLTWLILGFDFILWGMNLSRISFNQLGVACSERCFVF